MARRSIGDTPLASDNSAAVDINGDTSAFMRSSFSLDIGPAMIRIARTSPFVARTVVAIELIDGRNMS